MVLKVFTNVTCEMHRMKRSAMLCAERHIGVSDVTKTYPGYQGISFPLTGAGNVPYLILFHYYFIFLPGWDWIHLVLRLLLGLLYQTHTQTQNQMMMMSVEQSVECELAGETKVLGESLPNTILSTTNPTWPDPGSNPDRRGEKPETNRLSYGAAHYYFMFN
jgi:hypothetical protein